MTAEQALLPCPLCKRTPETYFAPEDEFGSWDTHSVSCSQPNEHHVVTMGHTAEQAASLWNTRVSPPLVDNVADVSVEAGKCEVLDQQAVSDALATYNESYGNGVDKGQCIRRAIRKYLDTLGLDAEGRPYAIKQRLGGKSEDQ